MFETLKTSEWTKPLRNAGIVGAGKAMQGLMSLGYIAFAARALGPKEFGFLVLIHGLVFGLSQILRLQTWQAVLRYGALAIHDENRERLHRLIRFCGTMDIYAALFGLLIVQVVMRPAAEVFGLPEEALLYAHIYGFAIVFMILNPTQLGILRLFDKFEWIAAQTIIEGFIRLFGGLILLIISGGLSQFLLLWAGACVISRLVLMAMARRALNAEGFAQNEKSSLLLNPLNSPEDGLWGFIMSHNIARSVVACQPHLALFAVGVIIGPAASGVFRIAQQFSDILVKPSNKFLVPAIYPELARFQAKGDSEARRHVVKRNAMFVAVIAVALFMVLAVAGEYLIVAIAGEDYRSAFLPMLILAFAGLITTLSFPLEPMLSAAGRMGKMILSYGVSLLIYLGSLYLLTLYFGLIGAAGSAVSAVLVSALMMFYFGCDLFKKDKGQS